jgi:chromosome segregation ATPase
VSDDRNERMMARAQHYANGGLSQVDQLRAELQLEHAKNDAWHKRGEVLQAEVERLKAELEESAAFGLGNVEAVNQLRESNGSLQKAWNDEHESATTRIDDLLTQLRELREAAEDARETLRQLGWKPVRLDAVLAKVKP